MSRDPLADPAPLIRRVYAYVAYRVGDGPEAEDITSDTFERALRYRANYDPRKGTPTAWLMGIARRSIADALGRRSGDVPFDEWLAADPAALGSAESVDAGRADLHDALKRLDPRTRDLLALRYGADLTSREIGALLEMRANTVDVAIHRALEELRRALSSSSGSG